MFLFCTYGSISLGRYMKILKDLPDLIEKQIITEETAEKIRQYYHHKQKRVSSVFLFGVFGTLLVGLGLILIIAHNWDTLPKAVKTVLAFVPLLLGQGLSVYTLVKKNGNRTWQESSSIFVFFGFGAAIALISQVYHIPGDLADFLFPWMLVTLPLIYLSQSSITALLYLAGITAYAFNYWGGGPPYFYLLFIAGILPYYYKLNKKNQNSNILPFFNLFLLVSLASTMDLWFASFFLDRLLYLDFFGLCLVFAAMPFIKAQRLKGLFFQLFGQGGLLIMLFMFSFKSAWYQQSRDTLSMFVHPEFFITIVVFFIVAGLLIRQFRRTKLVHIHPLYLAVIPAFLIFLLGFFSPISVWFINALIFFLGVQLIIKGLKEINLHTLNYGLVIVVALVLMRFFDTSLSFALRGILFVIIGAGFFTANYVILKKRRPHE